MVRTRRGVRTGLAKAADRHVDEIGTHGAHCRFAHPHALGGAGPEVLHEDVRGLDQTLEQQKPARVFEVEDHRAFVAIGRGEHRRQAGALATITADEVARTRRLDLDHVGALIAEQHRRHRSRNHLGDVDDANAVERAGHGYR
jgi:hypothetical protein